MPGKGKAIAPDDWVVSNPWPWMTLALGAAGLAALGTLLNVGSLRFLLVFLGLLAASISLSVGFSSPRLFLSAPRVRGFLLLLLAAYAVQAGYYTVLYVLSLSGSEVRLFFGETNVLQPAGLFIVWCLVVPWSGLAVWEIFRRLKEQPPAFDPWVERAGFLWLAAATLRLAIWGLVAASPDDPADPFTLRLFLSVLSMVAQVAAAVVVLEPRMRRLAVSLLILFHFGGICTAVMSAPPIPWLFGQVWTRIYRPYLEFMYLNNAYHFYAPEPGPPSYLWFRVFYLDPAYPDKKPVGHWVKIPDVDEEGWHQHAVSLEYQRYLALTENAVPSEGAPPSFEPVKKVIDGKEVIKWLPARYYALRMAYTPYFDDRKAKDEEIVGEKPLELDPHRLRVPIHPFIPPAQQYLAPNASTKKLLESYALHAAGRTHPQHADWQVHSVKVYRVIHTIPPVAPYLYGLPANDPEFYRPYYVGEFDPQGKLTSDDDDPFLYWLLPILRRDTANRWSPIESFVHKHAGDPAWLYSPDDRKWLEKL